MCKKYLKSLILGASLFFALPVAHVASAEAAKQLIVATDAEFIPFEFQKNGKLLGFDVDLFNEIGKRLKLNYKWQPMSFSGIVPGMQSGNIDIAIAGMSITDKRKAVVDFSEPYYDAGLSIMTRIDNTTIKSAEDLAGKKVGSKTGTIAIDYLKKNTPKAIVTSYQTDDGAILDLLAGRLDAVVYDAPVLAHYANTAGKGKVKIVKQVTSGDHYGIAFVKGSPLVAKVNATLDAMKKDGTYKKIYEKWFGHLN